MGIMNFLNEVCDAMLEVAEERERVKDKQKYLLNEIDKYNRDARIYGCDTIDTNAPSATRRVTKRTVVTSSNSNFIVVDKTARFNSRSAAVKYLEACGLSRIDPNTYMDKFGTVYTIRYADYRYKIV